MLLVLFVFVQVSLGFWSDKFVNQFFFFFNIFIVCENICIERLEI